MTPKIIELKQAPVVLVELGVDDVSYYNIDHFVRKGLETEGYMFEGFLSDLTEEQFAECVDNEEFYYKCYTDQEEVKEDGRRSLLVGFSIAKDSFYSLLKSEGVYTENPYARPSYHEADRNYWMLEDKWQEAQSRTIDPTRTVVLLRKEGA